MPTHPTTHTYEDFLAALPAERRQAAEQVWPVVRAALPSGYHEQASPKFLQFVADGEMVVGLASQKNYLSLYLTPMYLMPELRAQLKAAAPKLKAGKSCLNFINAAELPLAAIGKMLQEIPPQQFLQQVQANKLSPHQS